MKIDYELFNKIMFIILGSIFVFEGLEIAFDFGLNQFLFHIFLLVFCFNLGVYGGRHWIT